MSLKVEQLTKIFGEQKAVNNISFEIEPGHVVGFLGPNGAGKSTTMKMLSCFMPPTSGKAFVCGFDVEKDTVAARRHLGYLPEKNPLYYDMYVREFLEFTAGIYQLGKSSKSRIDEIISLTGLEKEVKKKISTLSKGYKQRVGLAQAIIHRPKALILDEPTSGLDPNQIIAIRQLIKHISNETTVLLSTHIMQEVQAMCSRVIIINNGNIVADDKIENIQAEKHNKQQSNLGLLVAWEESISKQQLSQLEHLEKAEYLTNGQWRLIGREFDLLRKEILSWSLNNNVNIISIQKEQHSLEDTFRQLTKNNED